MSSKISSYHVISHPRGGWAVKIAGADRVIRHFETQKQATSWACEIVASPGRVVVHAKDGSIKEERVHAGGGLHLPQDKEKAKSH